MMSEQRFDEISFKLDPNSCMLVEYGRKSHFPFISIKIIPKI